MVTLAEVARQAGVSPSTVSYVLSRKRSISDETRRKVEAAIESWVTTRTPAPARWRRTAPTSWP
jgi:DNA-binding LacI/PurR family transcriptional regulator